MNYLITFFLIIVTLNANGQHPILFPYPDHVERSNDTFYIDQHTTMYVENEKGRSVAQLLSQKLQPVTGYLFLNNVKKDQPNQIRFFINDSVEHNEGYRLTVNRQYIDLTAKTEAGLFYASQTLLQLLSNDIEEDMPVNKTHWEVPGLSIKDHPKFSYRGMHLDVSRHFYDISFVKQYIDWLAAHKFNKFQWHLTDDQGWRIEIKSYPKLTSVGGYRENTVVGHTYDYQTMFDNKPHGGFYTQNQIIDVIAYAKERHVEIIPEIDIPGHSTAIIAAYPEFSCHNQTVKVERQFGIFEEVLCPTEKTFDFLKSVYSEVAALFPSKYIHIGGDEVVKSQWLDSKFVQQLVKEKNLRSEEELQSYFIHRVSDILTSLNKTVLGWDEILEGGAPKNAIITSWRGIEGGIQAAKRGNKVVMTPYEYTYFDAYQSRSIEEPKAIHGFLPIKKVYDYEVVPKSLSRQESTFVIGVQGALWTEYIKTPRHAEYMIFPRLAALSEVAWSQHKDWQRFSEILPSIIERYKKSGINASRSNNVPTLKVSNSSETSITVDVSNNVSQGQLRLAIIDQNGVKRDIEPVHNTSNIHIKQMETVVARTLTNKGRSLPVLLTVAPHKALNKPITFKHPPEQVRQGVLNDGVFAFDQYYDVNNFAVFYGKDLDAAINLEKITDVSQIIMGVDAGRHRQLVPPSKIEVHMSTDGKSWQLVKLITENDIKGPNVDIQFPTISTQYLRVVAVNKKQSTDKQIPLLPLYIDEIAVF